MTVEEHAVQMLITGMVTGGLMKTASDSFYVTPILDNEGNYEPLIKVTGRLSGIRLKISIEVEG